jgi:23S rRNA (guanosine2251-2'-O)-methyltransferase
MDKLTGIHAVREALDAGRPFDRILIARGRQDTRVEEIVQLARARDIPVRFEDRGQLDRLANSKAHQGVVALAAARAPATLESILAGANKGADHGRKGLIVLLDGVEDPHNLGAVIRTALAAGANGVIIPERRAVGLTDTVARASAGALSHLPVAKVTNLAQTMEELKEAGYWLIGLDERADKRQRSPRPNAQTLRLRRIAAHHWPRQIAQRFRRRRRRPIRSPPPAPCKIGLSASFRLLT